MVCGSRSATKSSLRHRVCAGRECEVGVAGIRVRSWDEPDALGYWEHFGSPSTQICCDAKLGHPANQHVILGLGPTHEAAGIHHDCWRCGGVASGGPHAEPAQAALVAWVGGHAHGTTLGVIGLSAMTPRPLFSDTRWQTCSRAFGFQ
jgi:hypothetical protein